MRRVVGAVLPAVATAGAGNVPALAVASAEATCPFVVEPDGGSAGAVTDTGATPTSQHLNVDPDGSTRVGVGATLLRPRVFG
jgi:hypothetical protein